MYLNKVAIQNIRSIRSFEMSFSNPAGWHVLIGDNGSGKSTIVRAIALALIGPTDARALRLNLIDWINRAAQSEGFVSLLITRSDQDGQTGNSRPRTRPFEAKIILKKNEEDPNYMLKGNKEPKNNLWSNSRGWFSCAFGPFRRFTGGEKEWLKVYYSDPRTAAHLSVFGEDVALTEAIAWLKELHIKNLEKASGINSSETTDDAQTLEALKKFLNEGGLLPHGTQLHSITSEGVFFTDGNGVVIDVTQMSDGYRSILSMTFELIRQLVRSYGATQVFQNIQNGSFNIDLPGVVLVDEIDAHLHPTWQARIGEWFLSIFPNMQFIVTTHSPLVCRAAEHGTIWRLRAPGSDAVSGEVTGVDRERLLYGDLLDAYGTELFGRNVTQSESGLQISEELAALSLKSFKEGLSTSERKEFNRLKTITSHISDAAFE